MTIQEWFRDGVQYDSEGTQIWAEERTKDAVYLHHVADIRGWGEMQNLFKLDMNKAAAFQDEVGKFVAEAINEKLAKQKLNIHGVMQAEASASVKGAAVGKERGQGNTWEGFYCYSWIGLNDVKCKEQCDKCKKGAELREGLPY